MKKILYLIAALAMLSLAVSCGDDDEPKRGDGVLISNTPMINHMVNMSNGQVLGVTSTRNKLTFDTAKHTASLELHYLDGATEKILTMDGITAIPKRLGYYELDWKSDPSFKGYIDLFEGPSMRYVYQTPEGFLITSTLPDIFFKNTESIITYDDTTKSNKSETTMYVFTINPEYQTATIEVEDITHAKDMRKFVKIIANSVPYTVTKNGFSINAENLKTTARYESHSGSGGTSFIAESDKYPFKTFNATIDLSAHQLEDSLSATYMIGGSASVTAKGRTYPNH